MSTPEEPPQLTRRQLRELRNTAATPIITEQTERPASAGDETAAEPAAPAEDAPAAPPAAPLARAAEPISLPDAPMVSAAPTGPEPTGEQRSLTRREIRQRERLRTASVPVITSEVLAASQIEQEADAVEGDSAPHDTVTEDVLADEVIEAEVVTDSVATAAAEGSAADADAQSDEPEAEQIIVATPAGEAEPATNVSPAADERAAVDEPDGEDRAARTAGESAAASGSEGPSGIRDEADTLADSERRVVAPALGSDLLQGQTPGVEVPASFDQLLTRGSATGALSMPNALILSQTPEGGSLTSPVAATGEILITGTFALPDHYGATGTVPGHADGKDVDAVLVDGELPAASSPTPIAASAAISTIKSADEIIKPPAPERGSRLMVVLAITAGVLAVALAGVLILAITTGIF